MRRDSRVIDKAIGCGHLPRPASTQSRDRSQSPRSGRPADPRTCLIVSHQGWDMTQAVSSCGGEASDTTLDNAHVVEDYLARTTTMYRIIAVGRICSVRFAASLPSSNQPVAASGPTKSAIAPLRWLCKTQHTYMNESSNVELARE